jgi:hypothetical protein
MIKREFNPKLHIIAWFCLLMGLYSYKIKRTGIGFIIGVVFMVIAAILGHFGGRV